MKRTITAAVAALSLAGLAGCGSATSPSTAAPASSSAPAPAAKAKVTDAESVAKALAAAGLPAKVSIVFDEDSDPNELMGRPGQYVSKAAFVDSRVDREEVLDDKKGSVELGGGVEVFATDKAAAARAAYISAIAESLPILNEYTYQDGPIVLRLSRELKPSQAQAYKDALANLH